MNPRNFRWSLMTLSSLMILNPMVPVGAAPNPKDQSFKTAQLFYPPANQQKMIRVIGQGSVKQAADVAEIQILVEADSGFNDPSGGAEPEPPFPEPIPEPIPEPEETNLQALSDRPTDFKVQLAAFGKSVSEAEMKPLVKVVAKAAGVSPSQVTVKVPKSRSRISPFPIPSLGGNDSAYVMVKVKQPTPNKIEKVIVAAENHLQDSSTLALDDVKVNFKINECEQLKLNAFEAAVADAQKRAEAIAGAMKATLSANASVAEPFFNMFVPGCDSGKGFSLSGKKNSYEPGDPIEVVVDRVIFFTYTLEEN